MSSVLEVDDLSVEYRIRGVPLRALDGADLSVGEGQVIGIVGESGSGKSTLGLTIGRLLPSNARRVGGDLAIFGRSVFELSEEDLRNLRSRSLGFVFQNPISALDPTMTVARQLAWVLETDSERARREILSRVGLTDPERVGASYPHQLSGGMAQRVAIAVALARKPKLVVADEPTASLDASIRGQILELLVSLCGDLRASVLLLSHDLRAVAEYCQRVIVMYGGRVVELGQSADIFRRPAHPYTLALLKAAPGGEGFGGRLQAIDGFHPVLGARSENCAFAPRCNWAAEVCRTVRPESRLLDDGRQVLCHRAEEVLANQLPVSDSTPRV